VEFLFIRQYVCLVRARRLAGLEAMRPSDDHLHNENRVKLSPAKPKPAG
jgi:hypothetical protein